MATFSRIEVVQAMKETGLVPVFYHADIATCKKALEACYDGGIRVFEFTNRGDYAHEVFGELTRFAAEQYDDLILGVGSVVEAGTASLYMQLGANFIVSPLLNKEMATTCNRRKVAWMPGCGTISEINYAEELGAEVVKIFPGSTVGGPAFVKSVKGPMPWSSIMPTGGVSLEKENLEQWFRSGVHCVGVGSKLFKDSSGKLNLDGIRERVSKALRTIKDINDEK